MSGGGGGGGDDRIGADQPGMITMEDLESLSEDQLSDSGNGSLEEEKESAKEDDERLLRYWQDVARGHQVEVSHGKIIIFINKKKKPTTNECKLVLNHLNAHPFPVTVVYMWIL